MPRTLYKKSRNETSEGHLIADAARRSRDPKPTHLEDGFAQLQHIAGNLAVNSFLRPGAESSAGLPVGEPNDACEQEAERISAEVTVTPSLADPTQPKSLDEQQRSIEGVGSKPGKPLPDQLRSSFESRFGAGFGAVRVHTDDEAAQMAASLGARAFTTGSDVSFGKDEYHPETSRGQKLLAHELTHVVQQNSAGESGGFVSQTAAPQIQRSIFEGAWEGVKTVGQAIGGAISSAAEWVGERLRDASMWVINLIRDMPARLARLATTLWGGLSGIVTFIPEAIQALASDGLKGFAGLLWEKAKAGGAWVLRLISRVFDVLGGPELLEFIWHIITKARSLTGPEIAAASQVLGASAIRWADVRVSEGGLLDLIFSTNEGRAFATFHTINLPPGESIDTVVHELTHVYQYERSGGVYLGQALHAQITRGGGAYNYGGPDGLVADKAAGKHFRDYNREEQAQIAQDYYKKIILGEETLTDEQREAYSYFIGELRLGEL